MNKIRRTVWELRSRVRAAILCKLLDNMNNYLYSTASTDDDRIRYIALVHRCREVIANVEYYIG